MLTTFSVYYVLCLDTNWKDILFIYYGIYLEHFCNLTSCRLVLISFICNTYLTNSLPLFGYVNIQLWSFIPVIYITVISPCIPNMCCIFLPTNLVFKSYIDYMLLCFSNFEPFTLKICVWRLGNIILLLLFYTNMCFGFRCWGISQDNLPVVYLHGMRFILLNACNSYKLLINISFVICINSLQDTG